MTRKFRDLNTEALCRSILSRHSDTIMVQKPEFAVRKLKAIITAALKISDKTGFHAMPLRELAKVSGVSMGGLYAYFDSKTTLLRMILEEVSFQVERVLSHPPEDIAADPVAHLEWLIETHIRMTEAMLPWFTFSFMEAKNFPRAERRMAIDSESLTESYFANAIAAGIVTGQFRKETDPLLATLLKPLLQDWYIKRAKYRHREISIETYIASVKALVFAACLAPQENI